MPSGRYIPLSPPRRMVCDLLEFAMQVPTIPVQRRMNLAPVLAARAQAVPRPSWVSCFIKAYAVVCQERPELRRAYLEFPWPHLYEHPINVASVAVEREYKGETVVFISRLRQPDAMSLKDVDDRLRYYKESPIEEVGVFKRALLISRLPKPLRHLCWWVALNFAGRKRARWVGTYGVSIYSSLGAASLHPHSVLTTTLNYGVIEADGTVDVRLIYDHRVMDGSTVARALVHLEEVLNTQIAEELRQWPTKAEAA
ncbi:MAG TPA: hypothetical protein VKD72_29085 [Gemmataceae bacterium]|nr:hypothetical protein [Gemmataceae bacterium]